MPILDAAGAQAFYQSVGLNGFMSNQLPGTSSSPDNKGTIEAVPFGEQETSVTKNTLGAFTGVDGNTFANLNPKLNPEVFTNPDMMKPVGSTFGQYGGLSQSNGAPTTATQGTKQAGEKGPSRIMKALNDTAGINSYMSKFGSPEQDRMRAANMAFLNNDDSMMALRDKEFVLGNLYAGGQHYQLNEGRDALISDSNGNAIAADKKATRAFKAGTMSAEDYRESFKGLVKAAATKTPATPAQAQNPTATNPVPVSKQPINTNLGPMIDDEKYGQQLDSFQGMKGVGPVIDNAVYGGFLEGNREPMMRDPRKK